MLRMDHPTRIHLLQHHPHLRVLHTLRDTRNTTSFSTLTSSSPITSDWSDGLEDLRELAGVHNRRAYIQQLRPIHRRTMPVPLPRWPTLVLLVRSGGLWGDGKALEGGTDVRVLLWGSRVEEVHAEIKRVLELVLREPRAHLRAALDHCVASVLARG